MTTLLRIRTPAFAALAALLAACGGGGPSDLGGTLELQTQGRLERGYTISVTATANGETLAPGSYQLSVQPSGAAEVLADGRVKLLRAGQLTLGATATRRLGNLNVTVAAPPLVVFERLLDGNRDIWRVDLDGQNLVRLTEHTGDDQDPSVAGTTVVFVSYREGNGNLYSMPLAGGAATQLTTLPRNETTPALSPDGQRLAFVHDATGVTKLWTASGNGGGAAPGTPAGFGYDASIETSPSWAPGGNEMVFVATNEGSADLYRMRLGQMPTLLNATSSAEIDPAWSADGQWVAFGSNRTGGNTDVYVLRLATGEVTRLTTGANSESQPAWTPDGRLVYVEFISTSDRRLRWLDPADPAAVHAIDTGAGTAIRPSVAAAP